MKLCKGKIVELDPSKWYWFVIKRGSMTRDEISGIRKVDGNILFSNDVEDIQFVENPDRIAGIIVSEFGKNELVKKVKSGISTTPGLIEFEE